MDLIAYNIKNDQLLEIREAYSKDAHQVLEFVNKVCRESDFLTFGPSEFEINEDEEKKILNEFHRSENQLYLLATIEKKIVAFLTFAAKNRPRIRHSGEFSMVVQQKYWRFGIGSILVDILQKWAHTANIRRKIERIHL